jgi:hypothetical protein
MSCEIGWKLYEMSGKYFSLSVFRKKSSPLLKNRSCEHDNKSSVSIRCWKFFIISFLRRTPLHLVISVKLQILRSECKDRRIHKRTHAYDRSVNRMLNILSVDGKTNLTSELFKKFRIRHFRKRKWKIAYCWCSRVTHIMASRCFGSAEEIVFFRNPLSNLISSNDSVR